MIERARFWWSGRSSREQVMLAVLGILVALVLFWLLIVRPLNVARAAAVTRLETATIARGRVITASATIRAARRGAAPALTRPIAEVVGAALGSAGLTATRLDGSGDSVNVAIASTGSTALFGLLASLEAQGVAVERMTIRTNSDATLSADGALRARGR